jgi:hypothetical protein
MEFKVKEYLIKMNLVRCSIYKVCCWRFQVYKGWRMVPFTVHIAEMFRLEDIVNYTHAFECSSREVCEVCKVRGKGRCIRCSYVEEKVCTKCTYGSRVTCK